MLKFYLSTTCPNCYETVIGDLSSTSIRRDGFPVVSLGIFDNADFKCDACGAMIMLGDEYSMLSCYAMPDDNEE